MKAILIGIALFLSLGGCVSTPRDPEITERLAEYQRSWLQPAERIAKSSGVAAAQQVVRLAKQRALLLRPIREPEGALAYLMKSDRKKFGLVVFLDRDRQTGPFWDEMLDSPFILTYSRKWMNGVVFLYAERPLSPLWQGLIFLQCAHFSLIDNKIMEKLDESWHDGVDFDIQIKTDGYLLMHDILLALKGRAYREFLDRHAARLERFKFTQPTKEAVESYGQEVEALFGASASPYEDAVREGNLNVLTLFSTIDAVGVRDPFQVRYAKERLLARLLTRTE